MKKTATLTPSEPAYIPPKGDVASATAATLDGTNSAGTSWEFSRGDHKHDVSPVWKDARVDASGAKAGAAPPTWGAFLGTTAVWWFGPGADEEVHFAIEMPSSWDCGDIKPRVHWVPKTDSDGAPANQKVRWELEYTFAGPGKVFPAAVTVHADAHLPADAEPIANTHYRTAFADITPTADQGLKNAMLICRLSRTGSHVDDTYEDDAGLLGFDIRYIEDFGSLTP